LQLGVAPSVILEVSKISLMLRNWNVQNCVHEKHHRHRRDGISPTDECIFFSAKRRYDHHFGTG